MRGFGWQYERAEREAISAVDLTVEEGEFLGVVGPNEAGKTTLVSAVKGIVPHSYNGIWRGEVEVFGKSVPQKSATELALEVGFVFADPDAQFTAMTVEEEIVFGMENLGFSLAEIEQGLVWASGVTRVGHLLDKSPFDLSGGERQRVAIASVLAMRPRILILDEPTSMLDPVGKEAIFEILAGLRRERRHTLIVVEHNLDRLVPLVDRLALVHQGSLALLGEPQGFFADLAYLQERDVFPPDVTVLGHWARQKGHLRGPLPLELEEGVALCEQLLASARSP